MCFLLFFPFADTFIIPSCPENWSRQLSDLDHAFYMIVLFFFLFSSFFFSSEDINLYNLLISFIIFFLFTSLYTSISLFFFRRPIPINIIFFLLYQTYIWSSNWRDRNKSTHAMYKLRTCKLTYVINVCQSNSKSTCNLPVADSLIWITSLQYSSGEWELVE